MDSDIKKQVDRYYEFYNKIKIVTDALLDKEGCSGNSKLIQDSDRVAHCLSEVYCKSLNITELIEQVSETNLSLSETDLDDLSRQLIYIKIEIYDELKDWIKRLHKPLIRITEVIPDTPDKGE